MYNLRYHVASLVAVFLALAVGLLLGTVVAERGMITDQSSALVADLQHRFDEISAANEDLRLGLERDRAFASDAADALIAGTLEGKRILVLTSVGRADGVSATEQAIADAGGSSLVAAIAVPALGLDRAEPEGLAGYFFERGIEMAAPGEELQLQVAEALAAEWRSEGERTLSELLEDADVLSAPASISETGTIDAVVVMATADGGADPLAVAVGKAFVELGGMAVGAESAAAQTGVAAACAQAGLPAVGHITTPQGRMSLVWVVAGEARGFYGPAEDADAYYPPPGASD